MEFVEEIGQRVPATYLGDAVYVIYDGYNYVLRLSSPRNTTGQIVLEPSVIESFNNFREDCQLWVERVENERKESENLA